MKRILIVLFTLLCSSIITKAQSGWQTTSFDADELKDQEAYSAFFYTDDDGNRLTMWSNEDDYFRITSSSHIFNYELTTSALKIVNVTVGLYDKDNNLIEKIKMTFWPNDDDPAKAISSYLMPKDKKKGRKVMQYLKNEEGYIRLLAPLYRSNSGLDLKVPCIKSAVQKQQATKKTTYEVIYQGVCDVILAKKSIIGLSDSVSIDNYNIRINEWMKRHGQLAIEKDIESVTPHYTVLHVTQPVAPKWVVITRGQGRANLEYDIVVDIDTINNTGEWYIDNIMYVFSVSGDIDNSIPTSVIDEMIAELEILVDLCEDKGFTEFYIDDYFFQQVKNSQGNTKKTRKYLDLYEVLLLKYTTDVLDFPLSPNYK